MRSKFGGGVLSIYCIACLLVFIYLFYLFLLVLVVVVFEKKNLFCGSKLGRVSFANDENNV